jgi:hypothetical protein
LPGTNFAVTFNSQAYAVHGSQGVLLLHHHNQAIDRTQVITIIP